MLNNTYLKRGLDALCRAHTMSYFADGHRGAAIVSACFLVHENPAENGVAEILASMIDAHWAQTDLCAPFPDEPADAALLDRVVAVLDANIGLYREVGHNAIFAALALKTFAQLPDTITPARVDGICKLIECFDTPEDIELDETDEFPAMDTPRGAAEFILAETLAAMERFHGRGQGWSGHMLTFGRSLIDLNQCGYAALAKKGQHAFKQYVKRVRMGPLARDIPRTEHPRSQCLPLERAYWDARKTKDVGIGHCFKYPYGFCGLLALAQDDALKQRCLAEAYRVL